MSIGIRKHLLIGLILALPAMMLGCAGGGKSVTSEPAGSPAAVSATPSGDTTAVPVQPSRTGATVTVIPSGNGEYIIQGSSVDDIAGFDLTLTYDSAALSTPTVTKITDNSAAMMVANTNTAGTIRFVMISTKPFSGTVQLAKVSFAKAAGPGGISITSVSMVNSKGAMVK